MELFGFLIAYKRSDKIFSGNPDLFVDSRSFCGFIYCYGVSWKGQFAVYLETVSLMYGWTAVQGPTVKWL